MFNKISYLYRIESKMLKIIYFSIQVDKWKFVCIRKIDKTKQQFSRKGSAFIRLYINASVILKCL